MGYPKKKRDIKLYPPKQGEDRVDELMDLSNARGVYLPKSISIINIDEAVYNLFETGDLALTLTDEKENNKVPVILVGGSRAADFAKTYAIQNENKQPVMPYIFFSRTELAKPSTKPTMYSIPGHPTFTYQKVPFIDGGLMNTAVFKIPVPVHIELTYTLQFFTAHLQDFNAMDSQIVRFFQAIQGYIAVNGQYFPITLESQKREDVIEENVNRYFIGTYEFTVIAFEQDENNFEEIPGVNKLRLSVKSK
jgi:hypothetical protein